MMRYKFGFFGCLLSVLVASAGIASAQDKDFMWQAAVEKTSFMTNIHANKESGMIVAGWTEIGGKLYELNVRIEGKELLRENVKARIRERLREGQEWSAPQVNAELTTAVATAIFDRARVLYENDLN